MTATMEGDKNSSWRDEFRERMVRVESGLGTVTADIKEIKADMGTNSNKIEGKIDRVLESMSNGGARITALETKVDKFSEDVIELFAKANSNASRLAAAETNITNVTGRMDSQDKTRALVIAAAITAFGTAVATALVSFFRP